MIHDFVVCNGQGGMGGELFQTNERTRILVKDSDAIRLELILGAQRPWQFRFHFHAGTEIARILSGRARLRLQSAHVDLVAGDEIVIPPATVHRFESLDDRGWSFESRFEPTSPDDGAAPKSLSLRARVGSYLDGCPSLRSEVGIIAAACAMSSGHLTRRFRQETGTSLHNFHVLIALHKAKRRLRDGAPIVDAALDAGFYDQAHLTREFVRTFGMTPGAFRLAWNAPV